ncbi:MAG: barstar family protein [Clostridiales bacterium]|nr:barstar family protein [Clostridiales bacterium]MBR5974830.1 barstar family protein [Clostridiales bacterium]
MNIYLLDGKDMTSRDEAYRVIVDTMELPMWFGNNLDALFDCLSDLSKDIAVVFVNTAIAEENLGQYAKRILACFREAAQECGYIFMEKR